MRLLIPGTDQAFDDDAILDHPLAPILDHPLNPILDHLLAPILDTLTSSSNVSTGTLQVTLKICRPGGTVEDLLLGQEDDVTDEPHAVPPVVLDVDDVAYFVLLVLVFRLLFRAAVDVQLLWRFLNGSAAAVSSPEGVGCLLTARIVRGCRRIERVLSLYIVSFVSF